MRDLNEIQVFVAVADLKSFDGAARRLGLSGPTVSRRIASLERRLGVALLHRTTRSVRLTSAGQTYRDRCAAVLSAALQADRAIVPHREDLQGDLCVNAPILFGQRVLAPIAARFALANPGLRLRIEVTNLHVDPVETGCDLVIRTGDLPDSRLRARLLGQATTVVVGCASLLQGRDPSIGWTELLDAPCIVFGGSNDRRWRFPGPRPKHAVPVSTVMTSNDLDIIASAALAGLGFAILPRFLVADALEDGRLVQIALSDGVAPTSVHAIFPGHAIVNPGARALADEIGRALAGRPDWVEA